MAFELSIKGTPVLFVKPFTAQGRDAIINFAQAHPQANTILFVDTPEMPFLIQAIESLVGSGKHVVMRDHHDVDGEPKTSRDVQIRQSYIKLRAMLGPDTIITNRREHPACASIALPADEATIIVADPDPDGLLAAMTSAGATYPELMADADLLDGPPAKRIGLSDLGELMNRGYSMVPLPDPTTELARDTTMRTLFSEFIAVVQGDGELRHQLTDRINREWQTLEQAAIQLAASAKEVGNGIWLMEPTEAYARPALMRELEAKPGLRVSAIRTKTGPVAHHDGVQYSVYVASTFQSGFSIQSVLPEGFKSGANIGCISNTTFILTCTEQWWRDTVLPGLQKQFASA